MILSGKITNLVTYIPIVLLMLNFMTLDFLTERTKALNATKPPNEQQKTG